MLSDTPQSLPLDEREEALWVLQRVFPRDGIANQGIAIYLAGQYEHEILQKSVLWAVRRHPMLRSFIEVQNGRPVRTFRAPEEMSAPVSVRRAERATLEAEMLEHSRGAFDIERDELARFTLFELPDGSQVLLAVIHHLVFDALSTPRFVSDLAAAYRGFAATGAPPVSVPAPPPFRGPAEVTAESVRYWGDRLADIQPDAMLLHATNYGDKSLSFVGGRYSRTMSVPASEAIRRLSRRLRASDNIVLLAAYLLLLARHGAGPDLVVGVPVNLRSQDMSGAVGSYFSTLPLVVRANPGDTFAQLVEHTLESFMEAMEHRDLSYEAVIRRFNREHYDWQTPLFRHMFNFWSSTAEERTQNDWATEVQQIDSGYSRYDLEFVLSARGQGYDLQIAYRRDLHDEAFVRRLYDKYEALLLSAADDPERAAARLLMATDHDKIVGLANRTATRWRGPRTIPGMINAQIRARPRHAAIVSAAGTISYEQLDRLASRVSSRLSAAGVRPGDLVAVAGGRDPVSAAAIIGAWRVGAGYLPLDSAQPPDRLRFQLRDAGVAALVSESALIRQFADTVKVAIDAEDIMSGEPTPVPTDLAAGRDQEREPDPASIAYVIYTSGSTGQPKGVRVTHSNLANVVSHFDKMLSCGTDTKMLWLTTIAFDISALELLLPLSCGGTVIAVEDRAQTRPELILKIVQESGVDIIQATPTLWRMIAALGDVDLTGRWLLCGGEPLNAVLAGQLLKTGGRLVNVYGPTETTIWSTAEPITRHSLEQDVTIGRPIANTAIAVVDESGADCPVDIMGEVVIGGAGVAAGYLRRADLTAARFIRHGLIGKAYRTGDLGRWSADGRLVLHGRADRQVKIHGGRVELDEVELVLKAYPGVDSAAVVVHRPGQAAEALAAFVVSAEDVPAEELWNFAAQRLPGYALPSTISRVPVLPLNPSGKIDYRHLAEVSPAVQQRAASASPSEAVATDEIISWLTGLWRDLLDDPGLHADSNFFLSGGQSLLAISATDQLRERYGVDLPVLVMLRNPTPRGLAEKVRVQALSGKTT